MASEKGAAHRAKDLNLDNPHDVKLRPSRLPAGVQWVAVGLFVAGVALSAVFAISAHWRRATVILGASLLWLSLVRLTCDSRIVGVLAVRSRRFDATYTACLGALLTFLAVSVDSLGS